MLLFLIEDAGMENTNSEHGEARDSVNPEKGTIPPTENEAPPQDSENSSVVTDEDVNEDNGEGEGHFPLDYDQ